MKIHHIQLIIYSYLIVNGSSCFAASLNNNAICSTLATSPVVNSMPMHDYLVSRGKKAEFDNSVYLITLEGGSKAVFKPCLNDDDLADFYAEVVAYKASEFMGFGFVPPTIMRTIDGHTGSLQLFVETDIDTLDEESFDRARLRLNADDIANLKIFYFVFGQWDTGPHNLLIRPAGDSLKLIAIDNSGICNRQYVHYGDLPFVRVWYDEKFDTHNDDLPFPFKAVQHVQKVRTHDLFVRFKGCIPEALCHRLARHKDIYYVIYDNALWIQFHQGTVNFEKSFTSHYQPATIAKLEQLTFDILKENIFADVDDSRLNNNAIIDAIIERKDQVLAHYHSLIACQ